MAFCELRYHSDALGCAVSVNVVLPENAKTLIGMNTGARMAHLADALPMNRLRNADKRMKQIISGRPVNPMFFRNSAPWMAKINPKLL